MPWHVAVTAFTTVFLAELGDKTQLATLTLSAGARGGRWMVFLGSAAALIATSAIAAFAGAAVGRWVSPLTMRRIAGLAFVALGVLYLWPRSGAG